MNRKNLGRALVVMGCFCLVAASAAFANHGGPGRYSAPLYAGQTIDVGTADMWNNGQNDGSKMMVQVNLDPFKSWRIVEAQVYVGTDPVPTRKGNPVPGRFPFKKEFENPVPKYTFVIDLAEDLDFRWGVPYAEERIQNVAVHLDLVEVDADGRVIGEEGAWAYGPYAFEGSQWGWWLRYEIAHPQRGQFIDAPVKGLGFSTPTHTGVTGENGGFGFFPGEIIELSIGEVPIGSAPADRKISPLDLFGTYDLNDRRVVNVARLLQSLDFDGDVRGAIVIVPEVAACFTGVVGGNPIDWNATGPVDQLIQTTVNTCNGAGGATLQVVSAPDAQANLEAGLSLSGIFRKNISKEPNYGIAKQKLDIMPVYFPAMRSDGSPSLCADGVTPGVSYQEWRDPLGIECDPRVVTNCELVEIECREVAKPIISTYMQKIELAGATTDFWPGRFAHDIFTAVSRDDGATWKRMNISRMGDLSSYELETTGEPFPGTCRAPQMKVIGNQILAVWTSTFCKSGNPRYAIDLEDDYLYDDPYYVEDIWGVRGSQGAVDYDEVDDVADLGIGEIAYSCLWTARGVIVTEKDLAEGKLTGLDDLATPEVEPAVGTIVWFKPERLTSGRRDAYIPVVGGVGGAGFAIAWQEDPEGLRPGKGKGPGVGWSGAISNHKTDIWYSYVAAEDFDVVDWDFIPGGTPDEDRPGLGRPKALVPFSLPVRISDNDMVNTDTLKVVLDGSGLPVIQDGGFVPLDPDDVEDGNAYGTRRYAYLAQDDPLYDYYEARGGVLDICDSSGANTVTELLPDTSRPRWYSFINTEGSEKTVCITADGRLMAGDISASRPNMSLQPYIRADGTKGAWVLLAYEETKGLGEAHADDSGGGQVPKPIKQDYGKNVIYHSFDIKEPDLVSPGHLINLPATCGGIYETYCDDPTSPICTCTPGEPISVYFDDANGEPDPANFQQFRTEIARRVRFIVQPKSKLGPSRTMGMIIYKQGQEGQGRPADVFIRRLVSPFGDTGNPFKFANFECGRYLDEVYPGLPGYNLNVWGEPWGDRLCWSGGAAGTDPMTGVRGHYNLTGATPTLAVDAGPVDDTPDDPTDDIYGTEKVLLWEQTAANIEDESFMNLYSNSRSHRGFVRGDFVVVGFSFSPNWAAARNGRDRYNFYVRRSFDGGRTWTTWPGGSGAEFCPEFRTDPSTHEAPAGYDPTCVTIPAGVFEPARNVSGISNNKETDLDPRIAPTPPVPPVDGRVASLPPLYFTEDFYIDAAFFVAWGTGDNLKSSGGDAVTPEAPPLDLYYTRSADHGDTYYEVPWNVNPQGNSDQWDQGELVWRYDFLAHGEEEQGECQLRSSADGSKMYAIWHQLTPEEGDPDEPLTRWYPWEPEVSHDDDLWFRRVIFAEE